MITLISQRTVKDYRLDTVLVQLIALAATGPADHSSRKIQAIKIVRDNSRLGLRESKDLVDAILAGQFGINGTKTLVNVATEKLPF